MPSVDEVKTHITAAVDEMDRTIVAMRGLVDRIDEALNRLRIITAGSAHPQAVEAIVRFDAAKDKIVEAQALVLGGIDAAATYHSII